jgi:hypothetical protein
MPIDIEVQLEMMDKTSEDWTGSDDGSSHPEVLLLLDTDDYDGATYYFEVVGTEVSNNTNGLIYLWEGGVKATCTIPQNTTVPTRIRSSSFSPTTGSNEYTFAAGPDSPEPNGTVYSLRVIIVQSNATKTELQIAIGTESSTKAVAYSTVANWGNAKRKFWYYDSSKFSTTGTLAVQFEAILDNSSSSGTTYCALKLDGATSRFHTNSEVSNYGKTLTRVRNSNTFTLTNAEEYEGDFYSSANNKTAYVWAARLIIRLEIFGSGTIQESYTTGDNSPEDIWGTRWYAQTFTTTSAYSIKGVRLLLFKSSNPSGNVTVAIRATSSDLPTGADLVSVSMSAADLVTDTPTWEYFEFASSYSLSASTTYAIVVRAPSGDSSNYVNWRFDSTGSYSGGRYAESTNSGVDWTGNSSWDFMFETHEAASITKVETVIRCGWEISASVSRVYDDERRCLWTENYEDTPTVYHDTTGYYSGSSGPLTQRL